MHVVIRRCAGHLLVLSSALWAGSAMAFVQDLTAVFRPDPARPDQNRFINTTPSSGYCSTHVETCQAYQMFSIRLPITARSSGPMEANPSDVRRGAYWKVPAAWRPLTVINAFGEQETVEIRISGLGSRYALDRSAVELVGGGVSWGTGHRMLWGSAWASAPQPCTNSGVVSYVAEKYAFLWKTPVEAACVKLQKYAIPGMGYDYMDIAYELRTPNPLQMSTGVYSGVLNYSLGPYQDFDLGDVMLPSDSVLTLNFSLDVEHMLKVDFAPGANRIELLPEGGWQAWLHQGRPPARLYRDVAYRIAASSRFKMQLECSLVIGNTCGLRNADGDEVPLQVAVTLPNGLTDEFGAAITQRPLRLDGSGSTLFQPAYYVNNRPASLHFEVEKTHVAEMLENSGSTYSGIVTVIWDSEV
ncbi:hypothetical protein [Pseudomonas mucidolens]|uniref:hypothetical protein n=1 Tax=Pseudomonas mucidolens TaxID=46679 RepID=UPI0030DC24E4